MRFRFLLAPFFLLTTLQFTGLLSVYGSASAETVEFDRAEKGTLYFKVPDGVQAQPSVRLNLFDVKYFGKIQSPQGEPPYFLVAGRSCEECIQDLFVALVRPNGSRISTFTYPGRILDSKTRNLLVESRAFLGRCLPRSPSEVYVVFQKERVDRRSRLQSSVLVAQAGDRFLEEKLIEKQLPNINDTLKLVKRKECREIDGRNRVMLKKAFDLRNGQKKETDDEEDDDKGSEDASKSSDAQKP